MIKSCSDSSMVSVDRGSLDRHDVDDDDFGARFQCCSRHIQIVGVAFEWPLPDFHS